jgi:hypothetical protein
MAEEEKVKRIKMARKYKADRYLDRIFIDESLLVGPPRLSLIKYR